MDQLLHRFGFSQGAGTLIRFSTSSVFLQAVTMACNIALLRWLTPEAIGFWQTLMLIGTYSAFIQAGALNGLNRELPFAIGQRDSDQVAVLAGTARRVALFGSALCLLAIPATYLVSPTPRFWVGASLVLVGTAAGIYRMYLSATYRAAEAFETLAKIQYAEAIAAIFSLVLVLQFSYWGLASRYALLALLGAAINHRFRPLRRVGKFRMAALGRLLATGIPIFAFGYASQVANTFPRLVLLREGGVFWVGVFAPAAAMMGALEALPSSIAMYVYPQMTHRLGRTGDPKSLWPLALKTTLGLFLVLVPILGVLYVASPRAIAVFFPAYIDSVPAVRWTLIAGLFSGASISVNALNSLKAWRAMGTFTVAKMILLCLLPVAGVHVFQSIEGVALGIAGAHAVMFVLGLALVWWTTTRGLASA